MSVQRKEPWTSLRWEGRDPDGGLEVQGGGEGARRAVQTGSEVGTAKGEQGLEG